MKRRATLAFQELCQLMSDITAKKLTKPRKVKIFGYKDLTVEDVTKTNFKGVKLVAKASPSEDSQQNKAIKQKAKIDLYELFKDDPKVPGQIAMRRSVAKTFDISPVEIESWFSVEDTTETNPANPTANPTANPPATTNPPTPPGEIKAPTEASPLLGAMQKGAQAQVPTSIMK